MGRKGLGHQVGTATPLRCIVLMSFSYYLSSHHIDIHCWIMQGKAVPTRVVASAATGIATSEPYNCVPQTEDTITLLVDWVSLSSSKHRGTAVYTASWTAPLKSGVHSAQQWYYMAEKVRAHTPINVFANFDRMLRERSTSTKRIVATTSCKTRLGRPGTILSSAQHSLHSSSAANIATSMKYSPSESGHFDGQRGYGYVSIEKFIDAARSVNAGEAQAADFDGQGLPTISNTVLTTAILNAGRISLDEKRPVTIKHENGQWSLE